MINTSFQEIIDIFNTSHKDKTDLDNLYLFLTKKIQSINEEKLDKQYDYKQYSSLTSDEFVDAIYTNNYKLCYLDKEVFKNMPYICHVEKKTYKLDLNYRRQNQNSCLEIVFSTHDRIKVDNENEGITSYVAYWGSCVYFKVLVFDELTVYIENQRKRLIPCSLAHLGFILGKYKNECLGEVINLLLEYFASKNYLFKDIYNEFLKTPIIIPINLNSIWNYKDKRSLISAHCKRAEVPKSINKYSLHFGYLLMKCSRYVEQSELQKLLVLKDSMDEFRHMFRIKHQVEKMFILYYEKRLYPTVEALSEDDEISTMFIRDYVYMVMMSSLSQKFNLKIKSSKRIREEHDKISEILYRKKTPKVVIPKNSRFKDLKLPSEFEHITTKRRLVKETAVQHHCVWSYANSINKDRCAIYSTVYEDSRYTLEFRKQRKKYVLNQIKGYRNSEAPDKLIENVEKHLESINKKKK